MARTLLCGTAMPLQLRRALSFADRSTLALAPLALLLQIGCAQTAPPPPAKVGKSEVAVSIDVRESGPIRSERIPVAFDDAKRVASLVERALVESPQRGEIRAVLVDDRTGELVVLGTQAGVAQVRAFLSPGLVSAEGTDAVEVIRLAHGDARELAGMAARMVPARVRIEPDATLNAVIVSGDAPSRERVKQAIAVLDVPNEKAARATP